MNGRPAKGRKPTKKEATIKEKLLRRIKEYEFNWLQIPFAIFFISLIWIVTYTPKESTPTPKKKGIESFIGYDPSRDISEISHIDYTNGAIEYRLPDKPRTSNEERQRGTEAATFKATGTTLYDNNGKPIHIDASPEDILEQLRNDIDFDDLADYYDYYPDDEL